MSNNLLTALHSKHLALNAKMAPFAGFEMPLQYSTVKEEVAAVRTNIGMFDVGHMGEFEITGNEAYNFVEYLLPNDFINAGSDKAIYSPLCRENGTIIDDLIAYKLGPNRVLLCVNASNIEKDWEWISNQAKKFDCTITNCSDQYSLIAIQGPKSESILNRLDVVPTGEHPFEHYSVRTIEQDGNELIIARTGYTGEEGVELFGTHHNISTLWDQLLEQGVTPCGLVARDVLRLEAGFPLYGNELSDLLTPLDTGLKWTVRPDKNDFLGKKALCSDNSELPKYRQIRLLLEQGVPRAGYPVLNSQNEEVGKVTSGTLSPTLGKGIALASILNEKFSIAESYSVQIRNRTQPATRYKKPFITGDYKLWNTKLPKS